MKSLQIVDGKGDGGYRRRIVAAPIRLLKGRFREFDIFEGTPAEEPCHFPVRSWAAASRSTIQVIFPSRGRMSCAG